MCRSALIERKKNTDLRELLAWEPVSLVFERSLDVLNVKMTLIGSCYVHCTVMEIAGTRC